MLARVAAAGVMFLVLTSCASADDAGSVSTTEFFEDSEFGVSFDYPNGWNLAEESLTPHGGDGQDQVLAITTTQPVVGSPNCGIWPENTMRVLGPNDALVYLFVPRAVPDRVLEPWDPSEVAIPDSSLTNSDIGRCVVGHEDRQPPLYYSSTAFADADTIFGLLLAVGRDLSPSRVDEMEAIIDSISF